MTYREIVSVTGAGGLYQLVGSKGDGALLRQLGDNAVKFMPARKHSITQLETIEVYTMEDNVPLHEVFRKMQEHGGDRPGAKASNADIKGYFKTVYPELDEERVYVSDMKKMLKWYDILVQNDLLSFPEAAAETEATDAPDLTVVEEAMVAEENKPDETNLGELSGEATDKPAKKATKKAAAKKAAPKAEANEDAAAEAPKKKTAKKKKEEE